jgi:two-component system sensor histidine kinase TctE
VAAQKRFISDAAHQLRTPLAGLKSQTELALQETTDPALQARLLRVQGSAVRSAHLVNQLLTLARAEPESAGVQSRVPMDLQRLAQRGHRRTGAKGTGRRRGPGAGRRRPAAAATVRGIPTC